MEFIRELISERWIKVRVERSISQSKQKDLKISQGVLSKTLFLMAINGILGELGNGEDWSLFADVLAIYITTRSQRVASRALQGVTNMLDAWKHPTCKTVSMTFRKRRKKNEETIEIMLRNKIKESTQLLGMILDSRFN